MSRKKSGQKKNMVKKNGQRSLRQFQVVDDATVCGISWRSKRWVDVLVAWFWSCLFNFVWSQQGVLSKGFSRSRRIWKVFGCEWDTRADGRESLSICDVFSWTWWWYSRFTRVSVGMQCWADCPQHHQYHSAYEERFVQSNSRFCKTTSHLVTGAATAVVGNGAVIAAAKGDAVVDDMHIQ